ncbi:pentapeptide repeat-containing protein [Streptomyces indicus]|uniref:pentapeptide repeat-containing protein n=1 Tax=Streptomyces indicus TaxID=417292 RepID=UPI0015A1DED8|nr:pentapeptide repeat-containing protein [Streptomyces indicus]
MLDGSHLDDDELKKGSAALVTGFRTALVACVAALGASVALLYTARTYRLTRRGQITERFTKALERLGSDQRYVRIGGILALGQIVRDAPEQVATDAARVLGHFIRDRAPKAAPAPNSEESESTSPSGGLSELPSEPDADVQAALTALTRAESRSYVDPHEFLELRGLHLAGAQLHQADLTAAFLSGTTLTGADLGDATLTEANLIGVNLAGADLTDATLTGATLDGVTLTRAILSRAILTGAKLTDATLTGAILTNATLTGANLMRANLARANLIGVTLTKAHLPEATLTEASLDKATLDEVNLDGADLGRAKGLPRSLTGLQTDEHTVLPPEWRQITPS